MRVVKKDDDDEDEEERRIIESQEVVILVRATVTVAVVTGIIILLLVLAHNIDALENVNVTELAKNFTRIEVFEDNTGLIHFNHTYGPEYGYLWQNGTVNYPNGTILFD